MEGKQVAGDGFAGMSQTQLYGIMSQMKTLIEQNKLQAREILIQNPALTRALFQAQIMLGMVQPTQALSNSQASADQQSNVDAAPPTAQNQRRTEQRTQTMPLTSRLQSMASHSSQPLPQSKDHFGPQSTSIASLPQSSQVSSTTQLPHHVASQPLSHHQARMPSLSAQSQQPLQNVGSQYTHLQPPVQSSLPLQPRVPMPNFPQQGHSQMGPNSGFQHPTGPQMRPSQPMFHSGMNPHTGLAPQFQQGRLQRPNQPLPPSHYQAVGPHKGMEFSQVGSSKPPSSVAGQMGPSNQPSQPPPLTNALEKALLHQVMSLTPEQINVLPIEQRNQILQLQQMLRQ